MAAADRSVRPGPLLAALLLHIALFAALMLGVKPNVIPTGAGVPITLVASAPSPAPPKAERAPEAEAARTPEPAPKAPPPEPVPPPRPAPEPPRPAPTKPSPPKPRPTPTPTPRPAPRVVERPVETPAPAKPSRAASSSSKSSLDLDALQLSLARTARPTSPRPSFAERGPARAAAAPQTSAAPGISREEQAGLSQLLNRLWNPNCSVEGGDAVLVSVSFTVGYDGRLSGRVNAGGHENSPDPVVATAARRAIDAVHAAEPYQATYRGAQFRINFDARKACANR